MLQALNFNYSPWSLDRLSSAWITCRHAIYQNRGKVIVVHTLFSAGTIVCGSLLHTSPTVSLILKVVGVTNLLFDLLWTPFCIGVLIER